MVLGDFGVISGSFCGSMTSQIGQTFEDFENLKSPSDFLLLKTHPYQILGQIYYLMKFYSNFRGFGVIFWVIF